LYFFRQVLGLGSDSLVEWIRDKHLRFTIACFVGITQPFSGNKPNKIIPIQPKLFHGFSGKDTGFFISMGKQRRTFPPDLEKYAQAIAGVYFLY
jgi:hypothetical protein